MGEDHSLHDILQRQRAVLTELEQEARRIEESDLVQENRSLQEELERLRVAYEALSVQVEALSGQNENLKGALYEQMYNEKRRIASSFESTVDLYYRKHVQAAENDLTALEKKIRSRIDGVTADLRQSQVEISDGIYEKFLALSQEASVKITEAQERQAQTRGAFSENERAEFEALKEEQITDEQVLTVAKKNSLERLVGLNLLNIVGMLLVLFGVIAIGRYTYVHMSDALRSLMIFALGVLLAGAGEFLNRKQPNIVSIGMTAGGVGVLYIALGVSHFGLGVLGMYPALGVCMLITALAFFLSLRYKSQTILAFALVGGYLPMFSIGLNLGMIYGAMVYFVVLNLLALVISFREKWSVSAFVGLGLNIAGSVYMMGEVIWLTRAGDIAVLLPRVITVVYVFFAFLNYTLIPLVSTYRSKSKFRRRDIVLLSINTGVSSLILYLLFYAFRWDDFTGVLSLVLAGIYLGLGYGIGRRFQGEKTVQALFYITGLVFAVLFVPFQFDRMWITLGWLLQGVGLAVYGILKDRRGFQLSGFIIGGLCLWSFLIWDILSRSDHLFAWRYLAITVGSLVILGAFMHKKTLSTRFQKGYKYAAIVNLWVYSQYVITEELQEALGGVSGPFDMVYLTGALALAATFFVAYGILRIKLLSDVGTKVIACGLYGLGACLAFVLHTQRSLVLIPDPSLAVMLVEGLILLVVGAFSVFAVYDLMRVLVMERKVGVQWYPLVPSAYFVVFLTHILISQYDLSFRSPWISVIYVLTAFGWIVVGFVKRYAYVRHFGLGLSLLSVAKLFILDLPGLTLGFRILSYFALGLTLVSISFVYQYFSKRLELRMKDLETVGERETDS